MLKILHIICLLQLIASTNSYCSTLASIRIVEKGRPLASIVIPSDASEQLRFAAKTLQEYIQKASEAHLPIKKSAQISSFDNKINIWIGCARISPKLQSVLKKMDDDGFLISFPSSKDIIVIGPTDWGTEFGVYEFLEKYLGIRWLMPGPDGEHVPVSRTIDIPTQEIQQEPVFFSREISGLRGSEQIKWARRNRAHGRVKFHHNLINLFPPEKYTKSHPEFFPIQKRPSLMKGKRYLPPNRKTHRWQPCFTAPGLVEEAIKNICSYFEQNPNERTYSLGVNDSGGHCECEHCQLKDSGKINFVGSRDVSDRYFEWANAVVEGVLDKYPDKWFGCLAYSGIAEPPMKIQIHPRIIPYLTYDRMKWVDKDIKLKGFEITERWAQRASTLGWYDYIYGTPYMIPRVYFHHRADYYQYAAKRNVKAMYAEAYPNWGEGPKLYIVLKLKWDPEQDVSTLLNEWYLSAVGEKSAFYLVEYYHIWENFWTNRIKKSPWFKQNAQYLPFYLPEYLDLVNIEDLEQSRYLLEAVVKYAQFEKEKIRAQYLFKAFEYYEASALSYLGIKKGVMQPGKNIDFYRSLKNRRLELINQFQNNLVLIHPLRYDDPLRFEALIW